MFPRAVPCLSTTPEEKPPNSGGRWRRPRIPRHPSVAGLDVLLWKRTLRMAMGWLWSGAVSGCGAFASDPWIRCLQARRFGELRQKYVVCQGMILALGGNCVGSMAACACSENPVRRLAEIQLHLFPFP